MITASRASMVGMRVLRRFDGGLREFVRAAQVVNEASVLQLAAAISFYVLLALGPLMLIILSVVGFFFADDAVNGRVYEALRGLTGPEAAIFVEEIVRRSAGRGQGLAAVVGGVMFLWTASGVFGQLSVALANVRRVAFGQQPIVEASPMSRWRQLAHGGWHFARDRLLSVAMIGVSAALLILSLTASSVISVMTATFQPWFDISRVVTLANVVVSFLLFTALSAALYRLLARPPLPRASALRGGAVAALLFLVGRSVVGLLVPLAASESSFGPAASVITVLLWSWFSATTLLLGCAVGAVHAEALGRTALQRAQAARERAV
ncbi:MAG: YihY/virulence factor BrkB family protein [Deltaproteobacteria bacterium]|nr:YihY/virulence factor BrkB family protein [Deltaproteobacteria bacterium]